MYFRINEVSTVAATGNTYVHVDFWRRKAHFDASQPPYLTNDFMMHLRPAPEKNVRQVILDAIVSYWRRARRNGFSGDHTGDATKPLKRNGAVVRQAASTTILRDNSDPHKVLEQSEVVSLRGHRKEEREL